MNALQKAIADVKYTIPYDILNLTFVEDDDRINNMISIDDRILNGILRPRVLVDCNIMGGIEARVPLGGCTISWMTNREFIVEVPKELTNGKSIITALGLVSNVIYTQTTQFSDMPAVASAGINMMNNLNTETVVQTSRLELIGDNIIVVQDPNIHLMNGILRCMVENSPNMENINPRSYNTFSKLCILGVKSYIYNTLLIKLDKGYLYGGHELGVIKDIVDSYSGAEEEYQEYLTTVWRKVAFINDSEAMSRYVKSYIGNTI